jgi:hypothetical protein
LGRKDQRSTGVIKTVFNGLTDRTFWELIAAISILAVIISGLADRGRSKRKDINQVGFMPWTAITVFGVMLALLASALAIKSI